MFSSTFNRIRNSYNDIASLGYCYCMSRAVNLALRMNLALYIFGLSLLVLSLSGETMAAFGDGRTAYNDTRIVEATNAVFTYLEGSFGALVMVIAGVGAILSAAFGQYRSALGLFIVAIGSFILRSIVSTFFNDVGIKA